MSKDSGGADGLVAIGAIRRPVGLKGHCYVEAYGSTLTGFLMPVVLQAGPDPSSVKELVVLELRSVPQGLIARFEGYGDVDASGVLKGLYLFCRQSRLPPLSKGQHYHFELEGLAVVGAESGRLIGTVISVESYPTVDALEVRRENGSTVIVSMSKDVVKTVDVEGGAVTVFESAIEDIL